MDKFWYVYCPNKKKPQIRHETLAAAFEEANRLANQYAERYEILECIGCIHSTVDKMKVKIHEAK